MTAVETRAEEALPAPPTPSVGWDVVTLAAMVLGTPLLLLSINIRRGATALGPIIMAIVMLVVAFGLAKLLARWLQPGRALLLATGLVAIFYNWGSLTGFTDRLGLDVVPAVVMPLTIGAAMVWIVTRISSIVGLRMVLLAMSAGTFFVAVPSIIDWVTGEPDPPVPVEIVAIPDGPRPDVVVLVLDGYGRADVLDGLYELDNQPFLSFLEGEGFVVAERATTNYSMTVAALSSAMSLDYVVGEGTWPTERSEVALMNVIRGENSFMHSLSEAGYGVVYLESGWEGSRCGPIVDVCHPASRYDELAGVLLSRTPLHPLVTGAFGHAFTHNGVRVLEALPAILAAPADAPRVIFAHSTIPHGPLFLREDCSVDGDFARSGAKVGFTGIEADQLAERRGFYAEQVRCVNDLVHEVVANLPDDAVVVMIGDHGPDSFGQPTVRPPDWTPVAAWERLAVLAALRVPDACADEVYADISLVNVFRLVLRCLGGEVGFVEDRSLVYPHPPHVRDGDGNPVTATPIQVPVAPDLP